VPGPRVELGCPLRVLVGKAVDNALIIPRAAVRGQGNEGFVLVIREGVSPSSAA